MYLENRRCEEYLSGIKSFIATTEADKLDRLMSAFVVLALIVRT
jgi:hypothetical protein